MKSTRNGVTSPETTEVSQFWRSVVDPDNVGMPEAIAGEIAAFTGEPKEQVLDKMESGAQDFRQLWLRSDIDPSDSARVTTFYREQFVEAYELANWHSGRTFAEFPLNYARTALFARRKGLRRALDFGSGIGTGSLALAAAGCDVHSADIATELLRFVSFRMERRGFTSRPIDLNTAERPLKRHYDIITCFDVLEHVPDQVEKLIELQSYLRFGGFLMVNLFSDSTDPLRPMHISSAGDPHRLIRKTGMKPDWPNYQGEMHVLKRTRLARLRNSLASVRDDLRQAPRRRPNAP
jgi:2-polyprenyl-3-methyl-5-hydroxy-6-metoxy-1,4-benzoquinol methylase